MPESAFCRSCRFMTGWNSTLALKAMKKGSATAGIADGSFISKTINMQRSPLLVKKYEASGFSSPRIVSMALGSVPSLMRSFPDSTGIVTFSIVLICASLYVDSRFLHCPAFSGTRANLRRQREDIFTGNKEKSGILRPVRGTLIVVRLEEVLLPGL